jgi:hypothetical protein
MITHESAMPKGKVGPPAKETAKPRKTRVGGSNHVDGTTTQTSTMRWQINHTT